MPEGAMRRNKCAWPDSDNEALAVEEESTEAAVEDLGENERAEARVDDNLSNNGLDNGLLNTGPDVEV